MNKDRWEGRWKQLKGEVRETFGKLSDDDIEHIAGKRERLLGRLQERYGETNEQAEKRLKAFEQRLKW